MISGESQIGTRLYVLNLMKYLLSGPCPQYQSEISPYPSPFSASVTSILDR